MHFVARGAHLAALRTSGLTVESPLGNIHLPHVNVTDNPGDIGRADMVWLSVKLWDMEAAVRSMRPLDRSRYGNHLVPERRAERRRAARRVRREGRDGRRCVHRRPTSIGPASSSTPGTMQRLIFGEYDGRRSPRAEALLDAVRARRHQRGVERRCPQGDLGEVRVPRRPVGIDDHDARNDRPDPAAIRGRARSSST